MRFIRLLGFAAVISLAAGSFSARADGCFLCGAGSSNGCKQCRYSGSETFAARQACEKKGCKITGTSSCSTAANVKVCALPQQSAPLASLR